MSRRPEIIDFLRAEGLTVSEVNGWQTRGSETFAPFGSLEHWTVGAATGCAPSLGLCTNGRGTPGQPGYLPGPLSQTLQSRCRDLNGLDIVHLIACGRANHAGEGFWRGADGNTDLWGNEVEHVGTFSEGFPEHRKETSARIHTAFAKCSRFTADMVAEHREYATPPGRKVDIPEQFLGADDLRNRVARRLNPPPPIVVPPITTSPGSMEASVRLLVSVPVDGHRGYADLRKGFAGLTADVTASRVLALTFAGDNPSDGWGPSSLAPAELVDAGGVARIVVPNHSVERGTVGVYVTVAD